MGEQQKTVVVTGASAGFGAAIARRFASGGHRVVVSARRAGNLAALAGETQTTEGGHVVATPKLVQGDQTVGSLDRPAVKEAVALIMEGSDIAFKRRMALYGF